VGIKLSFIPLPGSKEGSVRRRVFSLRFLPLLSLTVKVKRNELTH